MPGAPKRSYITSKWLQPWLNREVGKLVYSKVRLQESSKTSGTLRAHGQFQHVGEAKIAQIFIVDPQLLAC
jgi:hypothetical protein